MIAEQLIWFIDARYFYKNITLDKVIHLANAHNNRLKIIIDEKVRSTERWYWHSMIESSPSSNEALDDIERKKKKLLSTLSMSAIKTEIITTQSDDYVKIVNSELATEHSLLIIEDAPANQRHPIFQMLTEINSPVLLLGKKIWKKPINIIGAVDPLHENDRPAQMDKNIIKLLQSWEISLKIKWKLVHACYISSVLYRYQGKVLQIHQEGLRKFAEQNSVKKDQYTLLEGLPEDALKVFITENHIDILFIGLVNRSVIDKFWVGSTTSHFLYEPPCDLLLVKQ